MKGDVRRCLLLVALGLGVALPAASAQNGATIAGRVVDKSTKAGIAGADVFLAPSGKTIISDAAGHFRFDAVTAGAVSLLVRRIGFAPESASFAVAANDDLDVLVELDQIAQQLDTVNVAGVETPLARGKLAGFYERKRFGIGSYIDAKMLEQERARRLGDVITSYTAGSKLVRGTVGSIGWIATNRDGARPLPTPMDPIDRRLGADPAACYPDVWIDGVKVYTFGSGARLFDINSIATSDVSAIEFYVGAARIPVQYNSSSSNCGVLLLWTR